MPNFSIVIPLYNKEKYFQNTLESVLKQTLADIEIIIVNDGSTDGSEAIVKQFTDSRIRYYKTENQGAAAARNFGIEKAISKYIAFLDADDLWLENHLETLHDLISEFPDAGLYASRYQLVYKNTSISTSKFNGLTDDYKGYIEDYFYSTQNNSMTLTLVNAIPKEVFEQIGGFNNTISSGQDIDMWARIALKYPVVIGNKVTASYLEYIEDSLSKTNILKKQIICFEEYEAAEKTNPSLKKYLDIYRMEYALHYKIAGASSISKKLYSGILKKNIPLKSKMLYLTPRPLLLFLLKTKRFLRHRGIDFNIYK